MRKVQELIEPIMPTQSSAELATDAQKFWSESEQDSDIQDWSHWKGKGRWDEQKWRGVGDSHFQMYEQLYRLTDHPRPLAKMAEWGPGGGANAVRFHHEVNDYYGVDISAANLDECQKQVEAEGFGGFHPVLIDAAHPEQCLDGIPASIDFFLSTAVYQHFPSKEYGIQVTELAYQLLADLGIALIQTRYDDGSKTYSSKQRNYQRNVITFTSYAIDEFWAIATSIGFRPLNVILLPSTRYAFYLLEK